MDSKRCNFDSIRSKKSHNIHNDHESGPWQFVAKRGEVEMLRATELEMEQFDNPEKVLLAGIAAVFAKQANT